jgi:hypothetical protein
VFLGLLGIDEGGKELASSSPQRSFMGWRRELSTHGFILHRETRSSLRGWDLGAKVTLSREP